MIRDDLTPRQLDVVEATDPVVLVLGAAGSGKTTTALWAAREHLLNDRTPEYERALFVTFSRSSVSQIASRARAVFAGVERRIEIHTFHSLAYRLLEAFGRYNGYGKRIPSIESPARAKLLGRDAALLSYDDLIPAALALLENAAVVRFVRERWGFVICDEFQDTGTHQWRLLRHLMEGNRALLLADPHQMIYEWRRDGVGPQRVEEARQMAGRVIELGPASHRDPSQVIPAMAFSILNGDFATEAVEAAIESGRLRVAACPAQGEANVVVEEIRDARRNGCRTVGVFETTNLLAAQLGAELSDRGISYGLLGIPEAQAEGLTAQAELLAYGLGRGNFDEARVQLAVFLTAVSRGNVAPALAIQIRDDRILSPHLQGHFDELDAALAATTRSDDLLAIIRGAWDGLAMTSGRPAWDRANRSFESLARRMLAAPAPVETLAERVLLATEELRNDALHTGDAQERSSLHLMNRHQTKGREWDGVILVFRHDGWVTSDPEPYAEAFRLLYVTLTRARKRACVLVPPRPHEVIAPFAALCGRSS